MNIIWLDTLKSNQIALSSDLVKKLNQPDRVTVHFGTLAVTLEVLANVGVRKQTIGLPVNFSSEYTIPSDIPYEIYIKDRNLYVGPVIAHVVSRHFKDLNARTLSAYRARYADYESIKGLIFVCTKDSVHPNQYFIEGYYYNPNGKESGGIWKYGKFPLPDAMFNRSSLSQKKIAALSKKIGNKIFNTYWFNLSKWNIWKRLSKDELLRKHLPYTEKYSDINQLTSLLDKYNSVYMKPFCQSKGIGILNVSKTKEEFVVVNNKNQVYSFKDKESIAVFLKGAARESFIIQQAVPFKIEDQLLDFRVFMQRDESKKWSFNGIMARISKAGSIITTSQGRKDILNGNTAFQNYYKLDDETAKKIENKMIEIVKKSIEIYEKKGMHIGDFAADIILDSNLHIWLLELQLNYAALNVPVPEIRREIATTPFRYAKALAGFNKVK